MANRYRYGIPSTVPFKFLVLGMACTAIISINSTLQLINQTNSAHTHPSVEQGLIKGKQQ